MKTIYLAGPITGMTFDEAQGGWRSYCEGYFDDLTLPTGSIGTLSPLRGKHYLRDSGALEKQYLTGPQLSTPQGIVRRDFNDIKTCDAVLACFLDDSGRASIGTCWEMGAAYALQKPVIAVIGEGSVHEHPFITQTAAYVFFTVEEACDAMLYLLGGRW